VLLAGRRAGLGDRGDRAADQGFGMLLRVADGGRAQDELRAYAIERADP